MCRPKGGKIIEHRRSRPASILTSTGFGTTKLASRSMSAYFNRSAEGAPTRYQEVLLFGVGTWADEHPYSIEISPQTSWSLNPSTQVQAVEEARDPLTRYLTDHDSVPFTERMAASQADRS